MMSHRVSAAVFQMRHYDIFGFGFHHKCEMSTGGLAVILSAEKRDVLKAAPRLVCCHRLQAAAALTAGQVVRGKLVR